MNLDYFTISALADAFRARLIGARLQRVIAVDDWGIGFELYNQKHRHQLYLSADNRLPRLLLMPESMRRGLAKPQPLVEYARSHLLGARLRAIEQPSWERILQFHFHTTDFDFTIIAEPMPRRANVLLVQDGIIRECLRRVTSSHNRFRQSLPGLEYQPPPPQTQKVPPWPINHEDLATILSRASDRPIVKALSQYLIAISPLLAREICHRASIPADLPVQDVDARVLLRVLAELVAPLIEKNWQAGIARNSANDRVIAFSVYPLEQYETWEAVSDINEALTRFYDAPIGPAAYDEAKAPVQAAIAKAQNELSRKRTSLKRGLKEDGELLRLQHSGELILAYQHQIEPGQTVLVSQYDAENPPLEIALDPSKSALENAQSYFRRYQKAKRARADGPRRLNELSTEGAFLEQLAVDLMLAENWPEIDDVRAALLSAGYLRLPKQQPLQKTMSGPRRFVCSGYIIWLGRNMRQNATILNRLSHANDLWFHVRGGSGAHAIIRDDGRNIPETLIQKVASMAAFYSSLRKEASVAVAVTERRHVRPIKGAKPGLVRYTQERTLWVSPQDESILEE